ncbi:hypothetical protein, partial [Streptomyces calidiresistens]
MPRAPRHICRICEARVLITITQAGRRLAVNEAEDTSGLGNTAVHRDQHGVLRSRRITKEEPLRRWERRYRPHPADC